MKNKTYTEDDIIKATQKAYKHLGKVIMKTKGMSREEKYIRASQSMLALYRLRHELGIK